MKHILSALLILACLPAFGATAVRTCGSVSYSCTCFGDTIDMLFTRCMANNLFTFYEIRLNGRVVNSAEHSDNIGPFMIDGEGWAGGNHLSETGHPTAKTVSVDIRLDGRDLHCGTMEGQKLDIRVENELYLPDGSVFAIERMEYAVQGNSIDVSASYDIKAAESKMVERYYGMQSMFEGETHVLLPPRGWLPVIPDGAKNAIKVPRIEASDMQVIIERSPEAYQAMYLTDEGLGNRELVGNNDVSVIINSYGKSYHKLIGNAQVHPADKLHWRGVYSWFSQPVSDTFENPDVAQVFEYKGYIGGDATKFTADSAGHVKAYSFFVK